MSESECECECECEGQGEEPNQKETVASRTKKWKN